MEKIIYSFSEIDLPCSEERALLFFKNIQDYPGRVSYSKSLNILKKTKNGLYKEMEVVLPDGKNYYSRSVVRFFHNSFRIRQVFGEIKNLSWRLSVYPLADGQCHVVSTHRFDHSNLKRWPKLTEMIKDIEEKLLRTAYEKINEANQEIVITGLGIITNQGAGKNLLLEGAKNYLSQKNKIFTGRPDRIYCSNKCGRSVYKRNLRIRKLSIDNEYEIALEKVNMGRCKVSIDDWVKNCNIKYDNYYDYTKVSFNKLSDVVTIICQKHGEFNKKATLHLHKSGCVYCCKNKSNIIHISDVKEKLHRNKYFNFVDFDVYKNNTQKIEVYCKKANHKSLVDARHLFNNNVNCSYCSNVRSHTTAEWIEKAIDRHQSKYDYSEAEYSGSKNKIKIICPTHGPFYQVPILHINGAGCRSCNRSIGESIISDILNMMSVKFESQKSFDGLKYKNKLYFDFYIPSHNLCIEFDGVQHHKAFDFFGGSEKLKDTQLKDEIKNQFCLNNNFNLLRISYSINYKTKDRIRNKIYRKIIKYLNDV
jgi:very-short-patch-repair endonuclease/ribosome-associated toxin RatA of RatAB toxin-antitoxin module